MVESRRGGSNLGWIVVHCADTGSGGGWGRPAAASPVVVSGFPATGPGQVSGEVLVVHFYAERVSRGQKAALPTS